MKIPSKDVIKITTNHADLDAEDLAALERDKKEMPEDLIWLVQNWGTGNFWSQRIILFSPHQYRAEALPDDSNNPKRTYGGRAYLRACVVGAVEGGFWIVAREKFLYLFSRDKGLDLGHPFARSRRSD